jgi:S1-C subfamily serine protease
LASILGGLVAFAVLLAALGAGALGKDHRTTVVQRLPSQPVSAETTGALSVSDIYKRDGSGVAFVRAEVVKQSQSPFGFPQTQRGEATGSGFVIDHSGDILTNAHVVQGATKVTVQIANKTLNATVIGRDASSDVALLKVDPAKADLRPLPLGSSSEVNVGDAVVAIGNPFGLDRTVTTGIVSALQRRIQSPNGLTIKHVIQTDAAINPGNSGGPLIDSQGRVVGITSQIATTGGGGSIGIGFAIPIDTAKKIAADLRGQ